jgi:hypothetical protein
MTESVTVERIEHYIALTAYAMQRHKLPQIFPTLKRLEAERDRLRAEGDPIEYAKRLLERSTVAVGRLPDKRAA